MVIKEERVEYKQKSGKLINIKYKLMESGIHKNKVNRWPRGLNGKRARIFKSRKVKNSSINKKKLFEINFLTVKDLVRNGHLSSPQFVIQSILGKKYPTTEEDFFYIIVYR